jgi:NitT/TauT family transport system ATP-binding protein
VHKVFPTRDQDVTALADVSFEIGDSEFFCVVGQSGCGKTTLLNLLAGFERPTSGSLTIDGQAIQKPSWQKAVVFQEHALFPWYTVRRNITFGLEMKGLDRESRRSIGDHYIDLVSLRGFEDRYPAELSGGMRQRVAIARALAVNPSLLLMDEPFGSLDVQTRSYMQRELLKIWQREPKTVFFVTHSIHEAVMLGDRVMILSRSPGRVKEILTIDAPRPRAENDEEIGRLTTEVNEWLLRGVAAEQEGVHSGPREQEGVSV